MCATNTLVTIPLHMDRYRFLSAGTMEEKVYQRQLSKEGLASVVEDKDQINELSSNDLKRLFILRDNTPSDTHGESRRSLITRWLFLIISVSN